MVHVSEPANSRERACSELTDPPKYAQLSQEITLLYGDKIS
ncbi:hypothetical protein HMPREF1978_01082 [Actinomyces graevenitzii F0530]|uniref:Uncharacterized protein n=1 Tax=Actinomyces graevenitzii F0530 TaxID=1321817 RepID=U1R9J2_9ACTO|nr:hypothetical protein HMPREF1978_01082 [Actinomyces graevenitzii F0530]